MFYPSIIIDILGKPCNCQLSPLKSLLFSFHPIPFGEIGFHGDINQKKRILQIILLAVFIPKKELGVCVKKQALLVYLPGICSNNA